MGLDPSAVRAVTTLLDSHDFQALKRGVERDRTLAAVEYTKHRTLRYVRRMERLTNDADPRVAFQATKVMAEWGGMATTTKLTLAQEYKAVVDELSTDPNG